MNESEILKLNETQITPFSNGTEAMEWVCNNCDLCKRAYNTQDELPDLDETVELVKQGRECELKMYIDFGFITGEIPISIAYKIGYTDKKGFPDQCIMFNDNDDDSEFGGTDPKEPIPDNQLCLPFALDEIVNNHEKTKNKNYFLTNY